MDGYYNQRQPLLQQHGQQYGHILPLQPHVQYPGTIPTYQGGYQVPPTAYPVGLTQQPAPFLPYHGNPAYNNNTHGYYHQPQPPQVVPAMTNGYPSPDPHQSEALPLPPIVNTNFCFSLCLCITWIFLLALPAIPLAICALICSINSKKLQDKEQYEKANKRGSYAMRLNIISFVIGAGWFIVIPFILLITYILIPGLSGTILK